MQWQLPASCWSPHRGRISFVGSPLCALGVSGRSSDLRRRTASSRGGVSRRGDRPIRLPQSLRSFAMTTSTDAKGGHHEEATSQKFVITRRLKADVVISILKIPQLEPQPAKRGDLILKRFPRIHRSPHRGRISFAGRPPCALGVSGRHVGLKADPHKDFENSCAYCFTSHAENRGHILRK